MFPGLEMWIWETEEDLRQLVLLEEVWEKFHSVGS
jgi:hypothetical protein